MPTYEVETPDGRIMEIEGDHPPNEEELQQVFASIGGKTEPVEEPNLYQQTAEAFKRSGIGAPIGYSMENAPGMLPVAGGAAGAILGAGAGPLGLVGGAAAGGAGGEAWRQVLTGESMDRTPESAAADIAKTGAIEGALTGVGGLAAKGAGLVLKAVRPAVTAAAKAVGPKPILAAARAGGKALYTGKGAIGAVLHAAEAGGKEAIRQLKPAAKAKLEHAIARGAKEAGKELPKATVKTLRDEITEHVANGARAKLTRQQIIDGLKQRIGSENFSPGAAGRIVDDIAKGLKVELVTTPGATARAAGQSLNQQIAAAQAKSGVAPHRGVGSIADEIRAKRMAENAAKAAAPRGASLLDEMTDQARTMSKSTGLTPEEMVQAIKKFNPGVGDREAFAAVQRAMRGVQ